jgi:hypothetical protein
VEACFLSVPRRYSTALIAHAQYGGNIFWEGGFAVAIFNDRKKGL